MPVSERQRQKKLQQKKRKRQQIAQAARRAVTGTSGPAAYANLPIHECLVPGALFDLGIGDVLFTRRLPGNQVAASLFLVDVFCLGVKNAMFVCLDEAVYERQIKANIINNPAQGGLHPAEPACIRALVEGAVAYAADLGFSPHRDYRDAGKLFGRVDAASCSSRFEYGNDGKPFYVRGPRESISRAREIVEQLHRRCGADRYHYVIEGAPGEFEGD
jgi:hypothetical protein